MRVFLVATLFIIATTQVCSGEIYKDFLPTDSLKTIKEKYPNATLKKENPAWAQENDVIYRLSGPGIVGDIVLFFRDYKGLIEIICEKQDNDEQKTYCETNLSNPDMMVHLNWVRWVPPYEIPLTKLIAKYGKPKFEISEDFDSTAIWEKRGILANLTNDNKNVTLIEYQFTEQEQDKAFKARNKK